MMKTKFIVPPALLLLVPLLLLAGCGNPSSRSKITPTINITQARQTVEARLTQVAATPWASSATAATPTLAITSAAQTPIPSSQISPALPTSTVEAPANGTTATINPQPTADTTCDRASPGYPSIDVTIDDDTEIAAGQSFTKIWRLLNEGNCTWSKDYAVVWFSGEKLGEVLNVQFGREVQPGESVEIAVDMVSPTNAGTYQSNWKLRNAGGVLFGIGPNGDAPFWVRIVVVQTETSTPTVTPTFTPTLTATIKPTVEPTAEPTYTVTLTPTLSPPIHVSGSATLVPGESIDLDTAQKNTEGGDDLAYQENQGYHLLMPMDEAMLGVYGNLPPTLEACQSAGMSTAPIAAESLSAGVYLCYRSSEGLPGWLQLITFNSEDFTIRFDFLTWAAP
jgi:hypothetical protein